MATRAGMDRDVLEHEWTRLAEQIQNGDCTPFLGAGACSGTLPTGAELSSTWADRYEYPFDDGSNLAEVMQYITVIERDPVTVKQRVAQELSHLGEPDFTKPTEPHTLLARFPMAVYLTTNYDNFMTQALRRVGKRPVTAICPWYSGSRSDPETSLPRGYEPQSEEPLVYHLHGRFENPPSLVLTEQDYVEFLINLVMDRGMDDQRVIPTHVLPALTRRPLLFIGYSLGDWNFRTIFQGLLRTVADVQRRRHISIQLAPLRDAGEDARRRAKDYLTRYFDGLNISVYWGSVSDFCGELSSRLETA